MSTLYSAESHLDELVTKVADDPNAIFKEAHRRLAQELLDKAAVDLVAHRAIINYRVLRTAGEVPFTTKLRHEMEVQSAQTLAKILKRVIEGLLELRLQLVGESSEGHRLLNEQIQRLELIAKFLQ